MSQPRWWYCPSTPLHTDTKEASGHTAITITHPFHPENGKECEYLGGKTDSVRCLDKQGRIRIFPAKITNLHESERSYGGRCVASIEELLSLKEVVDALLRRGQE